MDTSQKYIDMCRKAKELQETWKPEDGDFFALEHREEVSVGTVHSAETDDIIPRGEWLIDTVSDSMDVDECTTIWLPRIDQYLQMLSDEKIDFGLSNYTRGDSVEIVCLKLLMSNKYNKSWNGEDWIKQ